MTTAGYLKDLINQKQNVVNILKSQGFEADNSEKFNTLIPKLRECVKNGISETEADSVYANVIKQEVSGSVISVGDVSAIEHELKVNLTSDNITDFSGVTVSRLGKNLFDVDAFANEIVSKNSQCELVEFDGRRCLKIVYAASGGIMKDLSTAKIFGIQFDYYIAGSYAASFFNYKTVSGNTIYIGDGTPNTWITLNRYYQYDDKQIVSFSCYSLNSSAVPIYVDLDSFMIEQSKSPTNYEPYKEPQTAISDVAGAVKGLTSISPNMTLVADNNDVNIKCSYRSGDNSLNNAKFIKLQNAFESVKETLGKL